MYTSRIVGLGDFKKSPLVFFTLASQSLPQREMRVLPKDAKHPNDKRVYVFPRHGFEITQTTSEPEVDNYAGIVPGQNKQGLWAVAFNGHMAKRVNSNMRAGTPPRLALDLTLLDFQGARNDARIGAVAYVSQAGVPEFWLGINDSDTCDKRVRGYPNQTVTEIRNRLFFASDRNTAISSVCEFEDELPNFNPCELAQYIHNNIVGEEITFGLATGVAIFRDGKFQLGVYNNPFDAATLKRWRGEYAAQKERESRKGHGEFIKP